MKSSRSEFVELRGMRMHVRIWGDVAAPRLFFLHGWQDDSASFQFVVDALADTWCCIAPDWRGFGKSQWNHGCYWFPDYVADLESLLDCYAPDDPVRLIGHSMGGNVACVYAGIRPQRVARLVTLEGFGMPNNDPDDAPGCYASWLDQARKPPEGRRYTDHAALARRLQRWNPRLTVQRATFLAQHFGVEEGDAVVLTSDPYHKVVVPHPYRLEEAKACWRRITAPVLWVEGAESTVMMMYHGLGEEDYRERLACFKDVRQVLIDESGHNPHYDQPEQTARLIEEFMS